MLVKFVSSLRTHNPAPRRLARTKALVGSTIVIALVLAALASSAVAGSLSYGGPTSQGGHVAFTVVLKKKHHKLKLRVSNFSVTPATYHCPDGTVGTSTYSGASGRMSKKGFFAFAGAHPAGGAVQGSIQLASNARSATGTFADSLQDPTHGLCSTGSMTLSATLGG